MSKVVIDLSVSLDGFITGRDPGGGCPLGKGGDALFRWYMSGSDPRGGDPRFRPEGANARVVDEMFAESGAVLTGRSLWDIARGWGGTHPVNGIPVILLTHEPPIDPPSGKSELIVVTTGIRDAVNEAKRAAKGKSVGVAGADVAQQCLAAGLVDEIFLHLVPCLLGGGARLFDNLERTDVSLEKIEAFDAPLATHLRYRVLRDGA